MAARSSGDMSTPEESEVTQVPREFWKHFVAALAREGPSSGPPPVTFKPQSCSKQLDAWSCGWRVCAETMLILQKVRFCDCSVRYL